jgi:DNA-binding transcriptional MerR regulator
MADAQPKDDGPADRADDIKLTIEDLASQTGISVRNLRSHRARGLLPPPVVRRRVGYYGREHVARVQLIRRLQDEGLNLTAIAKLLNIAGSRPSVMLGLLRAASVPVHEEEAQFFTREELRARLGIQGEDEPALREALELGLIEPVDEEAQRYRVLSPSLLDAAEQVVGFGVPFHHALAVVAKVQKQCDQIAAEFIRLYLDDIWGPFKADDFPKDGWSLVTEAIDSLRPLSSQVVLAAYRLRMDEAIERETTREFGRILKRAGRGGSG